MSNAEWVGKISAIAAGPGPENIAIINAEYGLNGNAPSSTTHRRA